jgi:hypothetical protein
MRLLSGYLLALRKRAATYVVLGILLGFMLLAFVAIGLTASDSFVTSRVLRFPGAFDPLGQFAFGLGSLLAVAYAAAVGGGDWSWGIPRLILSRGESRVLYVLAQAAALAIVLVIGAIIVYAAGIVLTFVAGVLAGVSVGNPLAGNNLPRLLESFGFGLPVLLERAAIGFAVAIVLRSQVAGIIVGILLFVGETILRGILLALSFGSRFGSGQEPEDVLSGIGPEWHQYLPFSIGDSVISRTDPTDVLMRPVPTEVALIVVLLYLLLALAASVLIVRRADIAV